MTGVKLKKIGDSAYREGDKIPKKAEDVQFELNFEETNDKQFPIGKTLVYTLPEELINVDDKQKGISVHKQTIVEDHRLKIVDVKILESEEPKPNDPPQTTPPSWNPPADKPQAPQTSTNNRVKTGDTSQKSLYLLAGLGALVLLGALFLYKKRRQK